MSPVAPSPGRLSWRRCAAAALLWARTGRLGRWSPGLGWSTVWLTWGMHLLVAVSRYDDLWVGRHAVILVSDRQVARPRVGWLCLAAVAALAPWALVCALALVLAMRVDVAWLWAPTVLGVVALLDVGVERVLHPRRGHRAGRGLEAASRDGCLVLRSLAAHPRGKGHGARMMEAVVDDLGKAGRAAVLECRPELVGWYARWGFTPTCDTLRREATAATTPFVTVVAPDAVTAGRVAVAAPRASPVE